MSAVRKIGTVRLGGHDYDLAVNGKAVLAFEEDDLYGRPAARAVTLDAASGGDLRTLAQELLDALAVAMRERDAALLALQKGGAE